MTDDLDLATAARKLNVGVDYLETLMASGRLRDVGVDGARRIRRDDLMSFKDTRDAERREGLRDLTSLTEDLGGYERERSG